MTPKRIALIVVAASCAVLGTASAAWSVGTTTASMVQSVFDPDHEAKAVALDYMHDWFNLDASAAYRHLSRCGQRVTSYALWRQQHMPRAVLNTGTKAPAGTKVDVIAVSHEGAYTRVVVRVTFPPGYAPWAYVDRELDVTKQDGEWVIAQEGAVDQEITVCPGGVR